MSLNYLLLFNLNGLPRDCARFPRFSTVQTQVPVVPIMNVLDDLSRPCLSQVQRGVEDDGRFRMDTDDTPPPPPPRLPLFSEKTLQQPIRTNLTDYCSAHDLIAAVTESWDTVVYRLGGQVAFPVKRSIGNATITTLRWNASGNLPTLCL